MKNKLKLNDIPSQFDELSTFASDIHVGLKSLETGLSLSPSNSAASLERIIGDAETAEKNFQESRRLPELVLAPAQEKADADGKAFILALKGICRAKWGTQWSPAWASVGFVNGSLATPSKLGERESILLRMSSFLAENLDFEVAALGVTAVRGKEIHEALKTARANRSNHRSNHKEKGTARNAAVATLKKQLRWVINDLRMNLAADDNRWHVFGLVGVQNPAKKEAEIADATAVGDRRLEATTTEAPVLTPVVARVAGTNGNGSHAVEEVVELSR